MSHFMYRASVPVLAQMLGALRDVLSKAASHADANKIEPDALLQARLSPDQFALVRQVQVACDFAKGIAARLADVEVPSVADEERTFGDLQARIANTLAFIEALPAERFEASEGRDVVVQPGKPRERRFTGGNYLLSYGLPQFFFHVTTAYSILRHNGVPIGKRDYMGTY